jgi:hypothetical protein
MSFLASRQGPCGQKLVPAQCMIGQDVDFWKTLAKALNINIESFLRGDTLEDYLTPVSIMF